jgi:outer membrane protein assembly factor BamB
MIIRISFVFFILCIPVYAADWATWLGPNRDGKSTETGFLRSWPEDGPKIAWKATGLGEGYSTMAIVGDRIYTLGQQGEQQFVLALDTATGKLVWRTTVGKAFHSEQGGGPRSMPQVDGNRLYALAADGTLVCLETETGRRVWGFNYIEKFDSPMPEWAFCESPLIDGDRLIIAPGGHGTAVVALNKATGDVIWQSGDAEAGYSSVLGFDFDGHRIYTVLTNSVAIGVDAKDGSLLWRYERIVNNFANVVTPVYADGYVFYSSAYGTGSALLRLTVEKENVRAKEEYFTSSMQNDYATSIKIGDYLYGFSGYEVGILTAMEFKTGKVVWKDRRAEKGNCILADRLMYCQGDEGTVTLIDPSPDGYTEMARFTITRPETHMPYVYGGNMWTVPAIANGRLYIRDLDNLYAYDIKR